MATQSRSQVEHPSTLTGMPAIASMFREDSNTPPGDSAT